MKIKESSKHFQDILKKHIKKGCEFVSKISQIEKNQADIVISSNGGYPLDQNIYQAVKGMTTAESMCKKVVQLS